MVGDAALFACEGALPKITVEGFKDTVDSVGSHAVSGTLRNTGSVPCRSPKIVLGFYGTDGTLIETNYIEPDATFQKQLAPGKASLFHETRWRRPIGKSRSSSASSTGAIALHTNPDVAGA